MAISGHASFLAAGRSHQRGRFRVTYSTGYGGVRQRGCFRARLAFGFAGVPVRVAVFGNGLYLAMQIDGSAEGLNLQGGGWPSASMHGHIILVHRR